MIQDEWQPDLLQVISCMADDVHGNVPYLKLDGVFEIMNNCWLSNIDLVLQVAPTA